MAQDKSFVHLHLHTQYSLLDGANRISDLVDRVSKLGMNAVAMTDHGNLHGAVEFYTKARDKGIKPILGIEAYVAPDVGGRVSDRTDRTHTGVSDGGFHLVLLAENETGWQNLLKLSSDSYVNGFYYKPRMDKTTLKQWGDGIIAINGHLGSSIAFHLNNFVKNQSEADWERAVEEARWHAETFGPNDKGEPRFYIELQRHIEEQEAINPHLVRLARELSLPLVCDNDSHFLLADDWDSHDSLVCIATGKIKDEPGRLKYPPDLYVKSPEEMWDLFAGYQEEAGIEALENTHRIAERCNVELDLTQNHAPVVKLVFTDKSAELAAEREGSRAWLQIFCSQYELQPFDESRDPDSPEELKAQCDEALRQLSEAGLIWRYGRDGITDEIRARLDRELGILRDKDISSYFLICWDFVNEARRRGIPANARGSGVGTMVGYCLGLSNACPVYYGLLFERFTDPDRSEYPDIDIDICQDGRAEIIDYVRQKYDADGAGTVAQIITFNVLKAKAAIRDVGRVMNIPLSEVDKICKMVGDQLNITIDQALEQNPDLKAAYDGDPQNKTWIDTARRLEGLTRHAGVHAAGVVLGNQALSNILPLATNRQGEQDALITQWDGPTCERVGLLKMDFLGLRTLSIIERARQLVQEKLDPEVIRRTVDPEGERPESWDPLDLDRLTFDDPKVLDLFRRGDTVSVFQFESDGMRRLLRAMSPDRLEDLIAANALYRPGPMALIDTYNNRKHGREPVPELHPIVDELTAETYGIMIYQEQVMQIVHELGGIPLRAAYSLIKAISKKKEKLINKNRTTFLAGAQEKGLSKKKGQELFDLILKFAGYGFNKSHSTGYAIVAYQTAYLKTYFPVEYMAAVLTFESENTEKVVKYIEECKRVLFPDGHTGVAVRAPDINTSAVGFTPVFGDGEPRDANHGHIRFGLSAVKGVGEKAIRGIIEERKEEEPFESLYDFCDRVPLGAVNRSTIEALIKCGAFDRIHGTESRSALVEALDGAIRSGQKTAADRASGQTNLFGMFIESAEEESGQPAEIKLPQVPPWDNTELLKQEKSVLGFYVSSHPLDEHTQILESYTSAWGSDLARVTNEAEVTVGGLITGVRKRITQRGRSAGQTMAILSFEDPTGPIDAVVFSETFGRYGHLLEEDRVVFLQGKVQMRDDSPSLLVNRVIPIERAMEQLTQAVRIRVGHGHDGNGQHAEGNGNSNGTSNGNAKGRHANGNGSGNGYDLPESDEKFRHRLTRLRDLLWDSNGGGAAVHLEIHTGDRVVVIDPAGMRVKISPTFQQRVETVLGEASCCRFLGPPRIVPDETTATAESGESSGDSWTH